MQVLEQDMRELHKDVQSLRTIFKDLQTQLTAIFDQMQMLDSSWAGSAQATMKNVWLEDQSAAADMLNDLKELCGLFQNAENEYGNCENRISGLINNM